MVRIIFAFIFSLLIVGCSKEEVKHKEKYYQTLLCEELDGEMEYVLEDRTRVDCLTDKYAIEVDFANKWAEGVGQSLYYAQMTNKKAAIGLIVDTKNEQRYLNRLRTIANKYDINIFVIEK